MVVYRRPTPTSPYPQQRMVGLKKNGGPPQKKNIGPTEVHFFLEALYFFRKLFVFKWQISAQEWLTFGLRSVIEEFQPQVLQDIETTGRTVVD